MTARLDEVLNAALELPEPDRAAIVVRLLETLPEDAAGLSVEDPDFGEELERRYADQVGSIPWEQLRDEAIVATSHLHDRTVTLMQVIEADSK